MRLSRRIIEFEPNEGNPRGKQHYLALLPRIRTNIEAIVRLDAAEEQRIAARIAEAWAIADRVGMVAMNKLPGSSATEELYPLQAFHPAMEEAIGLLVDLNRSSLEETRNTIRSTERGKDQFIRNLAAVLIISLLVAGLMSRRLRKLIDVPLARLEDGARRFGDRDFAYRVEMPRNDEFGEVGRAFNAMAERGVDEPIERPDQLGSLTTYGVNLGQGYLFAKPLEEADFRALLRDNLAEPHQAARVEL